MATNPKAYSAPAKGNVVAIIAMFFLFAMISFVTNLAAPLGTIWQNNYDWFTSSWVFRPAAFLPKSVIKRQPSMR